MSRPNITELSGEIVETIHAPEMDGAYILYRRQGENGVSIHFVQPICVSYMPSLDGAREWVQGDRERNDPRPLRAGPREG